MKAPASVKAVTTSSIIHFMEDVFCHMVHSDRIRRVGLHLEIPEQVSEGSPKNNSTPFATPVITAHRFSACNSLLYTYESQSANQGRLSKLTSF